MWLVAFTVILASLHLGSPCNNGIQDHLSSKTPYRLVANTDHSPVTYEGCQPEKIWMLIRHGTRNPSKRYIDIMDTRLPIIRNYIVKSKNSLLKSDIDAFKKWQNKLDDKDEKKLTHEGESEMIELAERMQSRYPTLLQNIYSNTSFQFKFTHTQRTKASAKYFAVGLFGRATARDVWFPEPNKQDLILRFYKMCSIWRRDVKKNPNNLLERYKFQQSPTVKSTVAKIKRRIGNFENLTLDDVHVMYMTCAFESSWNKKTRSPWCAAFDTDDIKVFEYLEDLKYYWVDGYGHEITYKQACPTFKNMLDYIESDDYFPRATLYFTHSGTLLKVLAHLGLYDDEKPLTSEDYGKPYQWAAGKIAPFGTNLAFVKHRCGNTPMLEVRHQERVIQLPACKGQDLCDLEVLKDYYSNSIEDCDFHYMCGNTAVPTV